MSRRANLPIVRRPLEARSAVEVWRRAAYRTALVPTMGALHAGHLSLVRIARANADRVIASVFVNPAQFAPGEDFNTYPRQEADDAAMLAETGCDLVYAPSPDDVYPPGFSTQVVVSGVADGLESAARPHFFVGVATVVAKLLNQVRPDAAVFGEKDYQQLLVIRRLGEDMDLGVDILAGPTVREPDGLAMSSRNAYLDARRRPIAGRLNVILAKAASALAEGAFAAHAERDASITLTNAGFDAIDYVAVRDAETLETFGERPIDRPARVLAAVHLGDTRLIDNVPATPPAG